MQSAIGPDTFCFVILSWSMTAALRWDLRVGSIYIDTGVSTVSL